MAAPLTLPSDPPTPSTTPLLAPLPRDPSRLSQPFPTRLSLSLLLSSTVGLSLGLSHGARTASLRFRAENAHRLPSSREGWFLYHKTKNYAVMRAAGAEGARMAGRLGGWTCLFFAVEEAADHVRSWWAQVGLARLMGSRETGEALGRKWLGERDFASTAVAGAGVATAFAAANRLSIPTAARTVKMGLLFGIGYGFVQDLVHMVQGRRLAYLEWIRKVTRMDGKDAVGEEETAPP